MSPFLTKNYCIMKLLPYVITLASLPVALFSQSILSMNGGFETGDTSDWVSFPSGSSTFDVTNDAAAGTWAGEVFNSASGSAAIIKQANLGIGMVIPGQEVTVSFSAKGEGVNGGVVFAEFFTELDGGGTSSNEILSGAPLPLTGAYQDFSFTTLAGPDVGGGVTLQFAVITGANIGSTSQLFVDNVVVSVIPEPSALAFMLGLTGIGFIGMRRRR